MCDWFLTKINLCTSDDVDDHKYYEIRVKSTAINGHDVLEQIYDDPDSNTHVSVAIT